MKNCNEMVNSLLERREEYETEKKNKRIRFTRTLTPICCVCLMALIGIGAWQGGMFEKQPTQTANDAVYPGIKDWYGPGAETSSLNADKGEAEKLVVSSFGDGNFEFSYVEPENGEIFFSKPLNLAIDEYGDDVIYRVVMDMFCDNNLLPADNEQVDREIKRLSNDGYNIFRENIDGTSYIIMTAELSQLEEFSVNGNYGYFMFLYEERIDET